MFQWGEKMRISSVTDKITSTHRLSADRPGAPNAGKPFKANIVHWMVWRQNMCANGQLLATLPQITGSSRTCGETPEMARICRRAGRYRAIQSFGSRNREEALNISSSSKVSPWLPRCKNHLIISDNAPLHP